MEKQNKKVNELESEDIKKLLWRYFLPAFAGVIINSLYNIVDRIFIGQGVNEYALSGLGSVFPIMVIIMAFGMLIGIGSGVRISINMGKKDFDRAEKVLGTALTLSIIISVAVAILGFAIKEPVLKLFGVGEATSQYANDYLNIILFGTLFNIIGYSFNNIIRSEGNANIAMVSMLISAGINLALDPLFIFVFDMGVKGAAYATVISQFALLVWVLAHFKSKRSVVHLKMKNIRLNLEIAMYIFAIGFAPFSMQLASSAVMGFFNKQLSGHGGDLAIGAMSIIMSVTMLSVMSIIAINMAAQPIISFNHGAKNYQRVKTTLLICLRAATFVAFGCFVLVEIFPASIVRLFNAESQELLTYGVQGLRLFMLAFGFVGIQIVMGNYFQATGRAGIAALLSTSRQVIILLPILYILPNYYGIIGVWIASPISDFLSAIMVVAFLIPELKRLNNRISMGSASAIQTNP